MAMIKAKALEATTVEWAKACAVLAHESVCQTRKYGNAHYGRERYYFHPLRVAELVGTVASNKHVIAAAALHDVLEDVSTTSTVFTPSWMLESFGSDVLFYVVECSNHYTKDVEQQRVLMRAYDLLADRGWCGDLSHLGQIDTLKENAITALTIAANANRDTRKRLEAERYGTLSEGAKIIKRADLFDNSLSMHGAPVDFVEKWMAEKAIAESLIGSWLDYEAALRQYDSETADRVVSNLRGDRLVY